MIGAMRTALLILLLSLTACVGQGGQFRCDAPTANEWATRAPPGFREAPPIAPGNIQIVRLNVAEAAAELSTQPVRALTPVEAGRLIGAEAPPGSQGLRPFLVRAVFPVENPILTAAWMEGDRLVVVADGLGCAPYVKRPLVLWLDRVPTGLFVVATAAL
jgi:hypothetical protein